MQPATGQQAAPAAVNPLNVPTVRYYSFQQDLFGDPSQDPWNGNYQNLLAPFDIDINNGAIHVTPEAVRTQLTNSTNNLEPIAIILLHEASARTYLLPQRMTSTLAVQYPAHINDRTFALDGDLHRNCPLVVELPNALFNLITNTHLVPEPAHIVTQLAADPDIDIMGPFTAGDANVEVVRTRNVVAIPFAYVQLFLAAERVTPRMYFERIYPVIVNDGNEQACLPLTRFFQLAITDQGQGTSILNIATPPTGSRSSHLLTKYDRLVRSHFPQLDTNLQQLQNTQIASQIAGLTQAYTQGRAADEQRRIAKAQDPVTQWLGDRITVKLLNYCQVTQESQLPDIWAQLANAKSSDRLQVLQAAVSQKKAEVDQPHLQFHITLPLLKTIMGMDWEMLSKDSIETGLQPFRCYATDDEAALTHQQQVQLLLTGTSATLEDTNRLLTGTKVQMPSNLNFSLYTLRISVLMQILLPDTHVMVTFLKNLYTDLESFRHNISGFVTSQPTLNHAATGILVCKWVANTMSTYFRNQGRRQQPVAIGRSATDISTAITMESPWEPLLTPTFILKYKVREFCNLANDSPSDGHNAPPGPPAPSGPRAPSGPPTASRRVTNQSYCDELFSTFRDRRVKTATIRTLINTGKISTPLPRSKVRPDLPQCLGWHTKGECNTACGSSYDHTNYTRSELAPLGQWCQSCYPADQAAAEAAATA